MDELALALELDRRVALAGGRESLEIPEGWVVLHPELPNVHTLNMVVLRAPLPARLDAPALHALADRWLGHLGHRFVRVEDTTAATRLAPVLLAGGWEQRRTVFMVLRAPPSQAIKDQRATEISEAELDAVALANFEHYEYGQGASPDLAHQLVAAQRAMRAGTAARRFGAGEGDRLQSMCTLFLHPDVGGVRMAMVEEVGTLPAYRGRGLAKAVVSAAVAAAGEWGAELITVPADADDWPQLLYAKLGFEPVGSETEFTLRHATARHDACETAS
jgi:GNAT superfamily N-acetyltransferase